MKQVLNESKVSNFKILEEKPSNVLKRLVMPIADWKPNRNGRVYPKELWQKVVNSDYMREMINTHTLFGESSHPQDDRLEVDLANVSHAINNVWIDNDCVMGEIDILPTPQGKIINELIDYGSEIGISSRGNGSVMPDGTVNVDDYVLVTWDIVMRPSVAAARLDLALVESAKNTNANDVKSILNEYSSMVSNTKSAEKCNNFIYLDEGVKNNLIYSSIDKLVESMR